MWLAMACAKAGPDGMMVEPGKPAPRDPHCPYSTNGRISDMCLRTCVADRIGEFRVETRRYLDLSGYGSTPAHSRATVAGYYVTKKKKVFCHRFCVYRSRTARDGH